SASSLCSTPTPASSCLSLHDALPIYGPFIDVVTFNERLQDPRWLPEGPLPSFRYFVHLGGGEDWSMVAGEAPPGTERVEVTLDDGTVVSAVLDGDWLAAWLPGPSGYTFEDTIVEVAAYTPDGVHTRGADEAQPDG